VLWWIDNRQISNGEFGGGLSDDDDLTNCWPSAVLMGCEPKKVSESVLRMLDAIYEQGMFTHGLPTIQTDGLHAHEEGIEAQTQAFLVDYGSPKQLERIMETVRALDEKIMLKNKAGHRHFRSCCFSGTKIADESVWEWALLPQQFLLLQPVLTFVEYNGNPRARQLAIDMADGLLAHARKDENGNLVLDTEINFSSDSTRPSPLGSKAVLDYNMGYGGMINRSSTGLQLLRVVYKLTGDQKYLQPLLDLGEDVLGLMCENDLDILNVRETWGKQIVEKTSPTSGTDLFRHIAWQMTGNKTYLENYYADQIESMALQEYFNTEGSIWADRPVVANRELQRSRLGGLALVRGMIYSGHAVSWKFNPPANDESVAILVSEATPSAMKIVTYVLDQKPVDATMTAWNVEPGKWEITQGLDTNDDEQADTILSVQVVDLERSKNIQVRFTPRTTTILALKLQSKSIPYGQRPDWGIGKEDITIQGDTIRVKVHSLGSVDAPATTLALVENAKLIASVSVPTVQAPLDLVPKFADVVLTVPSNADLRNCSIQIDPGNELNEITVMNNRIHLNESELNVYKVNQNKSSDQIVALKTKPRPEHIAFNVKDPAAVAKWYCDYLEMRVVRKSSINTHFIADSSMNMTFELYNNTGVPIPDYAAIPHLSLHLAFMVDDLQATRKSLIAGGATLVEDISVTSHGDQVLMLRDPWGLAIQFVQRTSPMLTPGGIRPEHFALNVPDARSMTNWYFENLGMKVIRQGGPPTDTSFFADENNHMMVEVYNNNSFPIFNMNMIHHLSMHFAFIVDDVRSMRTGLIEAGAKLIEDLKTTDTGDQILMLRDPWGMPIQVIKRSEPILK
jgi:catechol 2,3-dioxygenase-like lactoylglutathione lyase family enzyme